MNELDILKAQHAEMLRYLTALLDGWVEAGYDGDDWCVELADLIDSMEPPK